MAAADSLTQGTEEDVDFFHEAFSLPGCDDFLWETYVDNRATQFVLTSARRMRSAESKNRDCVARRLFVMLFEPP